MGKVFKKLRCRYQKFARGARIKGKSTAPPGKFFATGFLAPERRNFDKSPTFGRSGSRAQNWTQEKIRNPDRAFWGTRPGRGYRCRPRQKSLWRAVEAGKRLNCAI